MAVDTYGLPEVNYQNWQDVDGYSPFGAGLLNLLTFGIYGKITGDIAERNNAQAETDYNRALQQLIFQREDSAVQRRVADLQKAGLSPLLATGSGAEAGAAINVNNRPSVGGTAGADGISNIMALASGVASLKNLQAKTGMTKSQQELIGAQIAGQNLLNEQRQHDITWAKENNLPIGAIGGNISVSLPGGFGFSGNPMLVDKYIEKYFGGGDENFGESVTWDALPQGEKDDLIKEAGGDYQKAEHQYYIMQWLNNRSSKKYGVI